MNYEHTSTDKDNFSLHDCRATSVELNNNHLIFRFPDSLNMPGFGCVHRTFTMGEVITMKTGRPKTSGKKKSFRNMYRFSVSVHIPNISHMPLPMIQFTDSAETKVSHTYSIRFPKLCTFGFSSL